MSFLTIILCVAIGVILLCGCGMLLLILEHQEMMKQLKKDGFYD